MEKKRYSVELQAGDIQSIWFEVSGAPARKEAANCCTGAPEMMAHKCFRSYCKDNWDPLLRVERN